MTDSCQAKSESLTDLWKRICQALGADTAPEIARRLGLTKQSVYQWQKGNPPGLDMLIKIAQSGDVSLDWLILGIGQNVPPMTDSADSGETESGAPLSEAKVREIVHEELARAFQQFAQAQSAQTVITNATNANFRFTNQR
jgi:transcriptional regulator with XRE-family HTH domain